LFGTQASLALSACPEGGTLVQITLPITTLGTPQGQTAFQSESTP
jgi:hypothetical protein